MTLYFGDFQIMSPKFAMNLADLIKIAIDFEFDYLF